MQEDKTTWTGRRQRFSYCMRDREKVTAIKYQSSFHLSHWEETRLEHTHAQSFLYVTVTFTKDDTVYSELVAQRVGSYG